MAQHNYRSREGGFWLVQRLTPRDPRFVPESKKGFDRYFELEYMGSSEFEFGMPREALARIREAGRKLVVQPHEMTMTTDGSGLDGTLPGTYTHMVWIVAHRKGQDDVAAAMQAWLTAGARGQESSYFRQVFCGTDREYLLRTKAWWSFSDDAMWSLDETIAQDLLSAIQGGA